MEIDSKYEPQRFERRGAQWWVDEWVFRAGAGSSVSLVIPPPNVTGSLQIGHMGCVRSRMNAASNSSR